MPSISISLMLGSISTMGGGASGPQISAPALELIRGGSPVTSGDEGDETALVATVEGVDTLDTTDTTELGGAVVTTDLDLYKGGVLVGAMTDAGGGRWTRAIAGAADPLLAADTGSYTARRTATFDGGDLTRTSAAVTFTTTLITATLTPSSEAPAEGAEVTLTASVSLSATITEVRFYEGATLLATDVAAPWEHIVSNITPGTHAYRCEVETTESGARVIEDDAPTVTCAAQAPTLSAPLNGSAILEGSTSETVTATGTADGFATNTTLMEWYREPNGGGAATLIASDATSGYSTTWNPSAIAADTVLEIYARRTYSLAQGGTATIDSARADVTIEPQSNFEVDATADEGTTVQLVWSGSAAVDVEFQDVDDADASLDTVAAPGPYTYDYTTIEPGDRTFRCLVDGVSFGTGTVTVAARPPTLTAPASGSHTIGDALTCSATLHASSVAGTTTGIRWLDQLDAEFAEDNTAAYSANYATGSETPRTATVRAIRDWDNGLGETGSVNSSSTAAVEFVAGGGFDAMAFVGHAGGATENTSDNAMAGTTATYDIPVGGFIILAGAFDNAGTTDGATALVTSATVDGNSVTTIEEWSETVGTVNAGVTTWVGIYRNIGGSPIAAGAAVAIGLAANRTAKAAHWAIFSADPDMDLAISGLITSNVAATDPPVSMNPDDAGSGQCLAIHIVGREGALTTEITPDNSYAVMSAARTGGGSGTSGIGIRSLYKLATGTGAGASAPTISGASATEYAQIAFLVRQVAP